MRAYIGAKIIQAEHGKNDKGVDGYIVVYPDGYQSWSPKDTFEAAYREISRAEGELVTFVDADEGP